MSRLALKLHIQNQHNALSPVHLYKSLPHHCSHMVWKLPSHYGTPVTLNAPHCNSSLQMGLQSSRATRLEQHPTEQPQKNTACRSRDCAVHAMQLVLVICGGIAMLQTVLEFNAMRKYVLTEVLPIHQMLGTCMSGLTRQSPARI